MLTLLDKSTGITLCDTGAGRNVLSRASVAQGLAPSADRWDDLEVKVSPHSKGNHQQSKQTTQGMGESLYQLHFRQGTNI